MPYVRPEIRGHIDKAVTELSLTCDGKLGSMNYAITKLCLKWMGREEPSYDRYQSVVGLLECVLQEFYRRKVAPYEDSKKNENGEVF